jgi:hypothetical protein
MSRIYRKHSGRSEILSSIFQWIYQFVKGHIEHIHKKYAISYARLGVFLGGFVMITVGILIAFTMLSTKTEAVWYNSSWSYRIPLTIRNTMVNADLTDFPVYVNLNDLPLPFHEGVKSDGCDIRVTKSDQLTEVPFELVFYTASTDTGELHFKADSLANSTDTVFYIYYGNPSASCYAENATYGAQNVWTSSYKAVYHLQQDPSGTTYDSTSNNYDMASSGTMTSANNVAGVLGGYALLFDGVDDLLSDSDQTWPDANNTITMQYWENVATADVRNGQVLYYNPSGNERVLSHSPWSDNVIYWDFGTCCVDGRISGSYTAYNNKWTFVHLTSNGSTQKRIYLDGVKTYFNDAAADNPNVELSNLRITTTFKGNVDEVRIATVERADTWISTEMNNQYSSSSFYGAGEQEDRETYEGAAAGYWKFDEGYGTTTNDSMPAGNDGTLTAGPTWESEEFCVSGKCIEFDGSDDYITVPDNSVFDITTAITLSAWAKPNTVGAYDLIVGKHHTSCADPYQLYALYFYNDGSYDTVAFAITTSSTRTLYEARVGPTGTLDNKWSFATGVYDGTNMKVYLNGNLVGTAPKTGSINTNNQPVEIGGSITCTAVDFDGFIDEVKIYPYARTEAQIKSDVVAGQSGQSSDHGIGTVLGANANQTDQWLSNNLAGYWKMDETAANQCTGGANDTCDSSGYGIDGAWTNNVASGNGKFGKGTVYDGTDDVTRIADTARIDLGATTDSYTVAAWVKTSADTALNKCVICKDDGTGTVPYKLFLGVNETATFIVDDNISGVNISGTATLHDGAWHHLAGVRDVASDKVSLYVDGVLVASTIDTTTVSVANNDDLSFGSAGGSYTTNDLNGTIDDARIYNKAFSSSEIAKLYTWAAGPVGYWKFDENTGATANDSSTTGNAGTITGSTWIPGKYGPAISVDGVDDTTTVTSHFNLGTANVAVALWVNIPDTSESGAFVKIGGENANGYAIGVGNGTFDSEGNELIMLYEAVRWIDTNTNIGTGWHHVAMIIDSAGVPSAYIDGVFLTTYAGTGAVTPTASTKIGGYTITAINRYGMYYLDDVRIYNYPRSTAQIVQDMNGDHPLGGSPVASMVGYWNFDEQQGQTINDKGFGANNGTLGTNSSAASDDPTWKLTGTSSCKINGCINLDGTADFVDLEDAADLDMGLSDWTTTAWVNTSDTTGYIVSKAFNSPYYAMDMNNSSVRGNFHNGTTQKTITATTLINDGAWHHVAITYDRDGYMSAYVDGKLEAQTSIAVDSAIDVTNTNNLSVGANCNAGCGTVGNYLIGNIDEVKIYNAALTANEIKIDMNAGSALATGGVLGTQDHFGTGGNPPIGRWTLDDNTGTSAADTSGNARTGTLTGNAIWTPGRIGQGVVTDGTGDYVNVTHTTTLNAYPLTAEVWFKTSVSTTDKPMLSKMSASNGYVLIMGAGGDLCAYYFVTGSRYVYDGEHCSTAMPGYHDGNWHHMAFTVDSTGGVIYVDGVKRKTIAWTGAAGATTTTSDLRIGSSSTVGDWLGSVDHAVIYDYVRSAEQIMYDYNQGAPFALYTFDDCQGSLAHNTAPTASGSATNYQGTITIGGTGTYTSLGSCPSGTTTEAWSHGTDYGAGKRNYALGLDGTNDIVDLSLSTGLIDPLLNYSLSAWVKPDVVNTAMQIYGQGNSANTTQSLRFGITSNGYLDNSAINNADTSYPVTGNIALTAGVWTHVAVTKNGSTYNLYINGKPQERIVSPSGTFTFNTSSIGYLNRSSDGEYFDGLVDDVRIYQYALTANQVQAIMNSGAMFFGPDSGSP